MDFTRDIDRLMLFLGEGNWW